MKVATSFLPEVIFLDLVLPDVEGAQLARDLRLVPGLGDARIVIVSGHGSDEDRRLTREAGCDAHFVKPLSPQFLESLLAQHI